MGKGFTTFKDLAVLPLHGLLKLFTRLPPPVFTAGVGGLGLLCKSWYLLPGSYVRRTSADLCRVIDRPDPRATYFRLVDKMVRAIGLFGLVGRRGAQAVAALTDFGEADLATCREVRRRFGGAIFVTPHCACSVLSGARFSREFPTVALAREPRSARRARIAAGYFDRLGMEPLFVRHRDPASVARGILKSLRSGKFVIGTTDLARRAPDTIEAEIFGQRVWLPEWPARFAARCRVPIVPMYTRMTNGRLLLTVGEPYFEEDLSRSTQRWADHFEKTIRAHPTDWIFMFDKHWSRVLAAAAEQQYAGSVG